ncbi:MULTISPECIES: protein-L-isoaspartate O-methyltransferase [unclassified Chelatococcus]|uniref:protein-L-isoaspartate O-methyltransferase family protein n=1 Tax=unclassified Chelatococcus TaxID=2638111 RepID=UPI001BCDAB14|nr:MULTISPECIES: protein-L-isoaspartate O-methyltransferase [unclassified Chelatococcus]MBS7695705.1 protein-L-isoaspartate O-methyltransferase [Chelatococcus sp. YT9]MBX3557902.1 protein-L-isoaspartate O-methyltransferase [Chelatococcus sp.]
MPQQAAPFTIPGPGVDAERGGPVSGAEETVAFLLSLRARGIRDTTLLRAMEMVPRDLFAPRRFSDLARADVSLPLPCGQTMTAPATIATMLLSLGVERGHRVLEVGTGSGYVAAVLGHLGRSVVSVERFRTLALAATERIATLDLDNVAIMAADGLAIGAANQGEDEDIGLFDRILLNGALDEPPPPSLTARLAPGGRLIGARTVDGRQQLLRITRGAEDTLTEELGVAIRLPPLAHGAAKAL